MLVLASLRNILSLSMFGEELERLVREKVGERRDSASVKKTKRDGMYIVCESGELCCFKQKAEAERERREKDECIFGSFNEKEMR